MKATIKKVEIVKMKGADAIKVNVLTEGEVWASDLIFQSAPPDISNRWWAGVGSTVTGWDSFLSPSTHEDLLDSEVEVEILPVESNGKTYYNVVNVTTIDSGVDDPAFDPLNQDLHTVENDEDELPI